MTATPEALLKAIAPDHDQSVLAAACRFPWDGRADCCAAHGIPCVLGHARSMQAIHGGTANNDPLDAQTIAVLRRGGRLPQASVSPAAMRATRDLLRRRRPLARKRGALLAHVPNTHRQDHLPAMGKTSAEQAPRDGVAERCADPAVHTSIAVDLALIPDDAALRRDVARPIGTTAKHPDAPPRSRRHTVPGIGTILRLVRLSAMHERARCPRGQDCASSGRRVTGAREAAGQRAGTSGATIGNAHLQGACSEAAVFCFRENPAGPPWLTRRANTPRQGKALTMLAHPWARAVYSMRNRQTAGALETCLQADGRGGGALTVALDSPGMHRIRHP